MLVVVSTDDSGADLVNGSVDGNTENGFGGENSDDFCGAIDKSDDGSDGDDGARVGSSKVLKP